MAKTFRPPFKFRSFDEQDILKIVSNALALAPLKPGSRVLRLDRTDENKLLYLSRDTIMSALKKIEGMGADLFAIPQTNYTRMMIIRKPIDFFDEGKSKLIQVTEETPIILVPLTKFDDWREARLRQRTISVKELSDRTRETLYRTILAVNDEFDLTSNPTVKIRILPDSDTENLESRRKAVEFLFSRDVVYRYDFADRNGLLTIQVNLREFLDFRDEIFRYYHDDSKTLPGSEIKSSKSRLINPFASMEKLRWQEITLKFVDPLTVRIWARETHAAFTYRDMGFEDARTVKLAKPDRQWELFKWLADNRGELTWDDTEAVDSVKKRKQLLSKKLKSFFEINEDPFYPYKEYDAYRIKIILIPEIEPSKVLRVGDFSPDE